MFVESSLSWIVHKNNKIIIIRINTIKQYTRFCYLKCSTFSWIFVYLVLWRLNKWFDNLFCYAHTIWLRASASVNKKKVFLYIYMLYEHSRRVPKLGFKETKLFDNNFLGCFGLMVGTFCTLEGLQKYVIYINHKQSILTCYKNVPSWWGT